MQAVITGATSFIGKKLSETLRAHGWDVVHVVRRSQENAENIKEVLLDMENYDRLGDKIGFCDCFIHLAWNGTRGPARMDRKLQEQNCEYSLQGVRSMIAAGCKCIVSAGSQAEYGPHNEQINENSECHPNTEYGKAKLKFYNETAKLCECAGVKYREPRFFSLYGPDDYEGTMIMSMLRSMLENKPCELTQGIQMWDFLYIDDAIEALYRLCTQECPNGVYNFGSGDVRQLKDYVLEMARITRTESELRFGAIPYPKTGMVSLWPDVSKLEKELGWHAATDFSTGIWNVKNRLRVCKDDK